LITSPIIIIFSGSVDYIRRKSREREIHRFDSPPPPPSEIQPFDFDHQPHHHHLLWIRRLFPPQK